MTKVKKIINKSEKIEIRISVIEKELVRDAANKEGFTISAWARKQLIRLAT